MRNDATEAALGLLGLTNSGHRHAHSEFATTPTIPLKRKASTQSHSSLLAPPLPSTASRQLVRHSEQDQDESDCTASSDSIRCICGFTYDDGFSIACDDCSRWVHAACFDISEGEVPEEWRCWRCEPRPVDRERAVKLQKARQRRMAEAEVDKARRRVSSPGVERKPRRVSANTIDGAANLPATNNNAKRKRRFSVTANLHPQPPSVEDEHVEIDEPSTHSYIHIDRDIIPHHHTRDKLKRLAQHWRGVTALDDLVETPAAPVLLSPDELTSPSQTSLHPLPKSSYSHSTLSSNVNPAVRPPSYVVRTTHPISSSSLIAPYTSTIVPSTVYLSDPLNSYAHLGMPKPFVHLFGPPLDVALDSRLSGSGSRFVRSGCRPNAVLRPVLCKRPHTGPAIDETLTFGVFALRDLKANEEVVLGWEWDDGSVIHHLPALIDSPHLFAPPRFEQFRNQMTSMLHAISSTFATCACGADAKDCALTRLAEFVDGRTPPTPSPSPPSLHIIPDDTPHSPRERRIRKQMDLDEEHRLQDQTDLGPLVGSERGFRTQERVPLSGGMSGVEMVSSEGQGLGMWGLQEYSEVGSSKLSREKNTSETKHLKDRKGKGKEIVYEDIQVGGSNVGQHGKPQRKRRSTVAQLSSEFSVPVPRYHSRSRSASPAQSPSPMVGYDDAGEAKLPPKLRKRWIHMNSDILKEINSGGTGDGSDVGPKEEINQKRAQSEDGRSPKDVMEVDGQLSPLARASSLVDISPHRLQAKHSVPASPDMSSPAASLANLSLLSLHVNGPAPHFPGSFKRRQNNSSPQQSASEQDGDLIVTTEAERRENSSLISELAKAATREKLETDGDDEMLVDEPTILGSPLHRKPPPPNSEGGKSEPSSSVHLSTSLETAKLTGASRTSSSPCVPPTSLPSAQSVDFPASSYHAQNRVLSSDASEPPSSPMRSPTPTTNQGQEQQSRSPPADTPLSPPMDIQEGDAMLIDHGEPQQPQSSSPEEGDHMAELSSPAPCLSDGGAPASEPQADILYQDEHTDSVSVSVDGITLSAPTLVDSSGENHSEAYSHDDFKDCALAPQSGSSESPESLVTAPPPKVKLSLKDFALRKRKQREEAHASPSITGATLEAPTHSDASYNPPNPDITGTERDSPPKNSETQGEEPQHGMKSPQQESRTTDRATVPLKSEVSNDPQREPSPQSSPTVHTPNMIDPNHRDLVATKPEKQLRFQETPTRHDTPPVGVPVDVPKVNGVSRQSHEALHENQVDRPTRPYVSASPDRPHDPRPHDTTPLVTLKAKLELVEAPIPKEELSAQHTAPRLSLNSSSIEPRSFMPPPRTDSHEPFPLPPRPSQAAPIARHVSQEDGEILSPPPARPAPPRRPHTPPTHPRSFHSHSSSVSPARAGSSAPPRRPPPLGPYRSTLPVNPTINSRPLPSGPRALRAVNGSSHMGMYPPNGRPMGGMHLAPRGPSADRDRDRMDWDRDRERGWTGSRGRGRGGGSGWGR